MGLIEIYDGLNWVTGSRKGQTSNLYKKIPQPQFLRQKNYDKNATFANLRQMRKWFEMGSNQ